VTSFSEIAPLIRQALPHAKHVLTDGRTDGNTMPLVAHYWSHRWRRNLTYPYF